MWAWIGVFLDASFALTLPAGTAAGAAKLAAFATIAAGAIGSVGAGLLADRLGRTTITIVAMAVSGSCAATVGLLFGGNPALLVALCLVWGVSIVADSAQFSASSPSCPTAPGWARCSRCRRRMGFTLTLVTIHLMPYLIAALGWRYAFVPLAIGPGVRRLRDGAAARRIRGRWRWPAGGADRKSGRLNMALAGSVGVGSSHRPALDRPQPFASSHLCGGSHGVSPRRTLARSLQLPRAVPLLDRRGSRFRHLRHHRRLAFRQGDDRRRRRLRPDDRDDRARSRQHPAGQLEGRRLSRRAGLAGAGGRRCSPCTPARRADPSRTS